MNESINGSLTPEAHLSPWLPFQASFASVAVVSNLIVMAVFNHDRNLLKNSALIFGYISGNITVSIACGTSVTYQFIMYFRNVVNIQRNIILSCLCTFAPQFIWLSFAIRALFLFALGADRFVAIALPTWYHQKVTVKNSWLVSIVLYILAFVSVAGTWIDSSISSKYINQSGQDCTAQAFASNTAFTYSLFLKMTGGTLCVLTTLASLFLGQVRMKRHDSMTSDTARRMKKQLKFVYTMTILALLDVLLVVIPNTFILLDFTGYLDMPTYVNVAGPLACCVNSAISAWTFLMFNTNIRQSLTQMFKCHSAPSTTVFEITLRNH